MGKRVNFRNESGAVAGGFSHQMTVKVAAKLVQMTILGYDGDYRTPSVDYLVRDHSFVTANTTVVIELDQLE